VRYVMVTISVTRDRIAIEDRLTAEHGHDRRQ